MSINKKGSKKYSEIKKNQPWIKKKKKKGSLSTPIYAS